MRIVIVAVLEQREDRLRHGDGVGVDAREAGSAGAPAASQIVAPERQ